MSFDVKSMGRKNNNFRENYVLNLPKYQMDKDSVINAVVGVFTNKHGGSNQYIQVWVAGENTRNGKDAPYYHARGVNC